VNGKKSLILYVSEWHKNHRLTKNLFWYKKHSGLNWVFGQNFGDYLSCIIVSETARKLGLKKTSLPPNRQLFAVGSVLHFAQNNDIVWGSGINGKIPPERHQFTELDIRMVRGPLTKAFLEKRGIAVPNVFGDPALLVPYLFPSYAYKPIAGKIIAIPNLNEINSCKKNIPKSFSFVSPFWHWKKVLNEILSSELVFTSSLHGIILSEAFGVPVRFIAPTGGETLFKYKDYYEGTGRTIENNFDSFAHHINIKCGSIMPKPTYNTQAMLDVFPNDIFV